MSFKHLINIQELDEDKIKAIFKRADQLATLSFDALKKRHEYKIIANLFFEPSTRTRLSFETAASRLGMQVLTMNENTSSRVKGESFLDTLLTLEAMDASVFIIRSKDQDVCYQLAEATNKVLPNIHIINAGGGKLDHPTQGLLDVYTMLKHFPNLADKKISIIGDIKHSRVARSSIQTLAKLGITNIHLVGPSDLLPGDDNLATYEQHTDIIPGITDADVIMTLRIQKERMQDADIPDTDSYRQQFGLSADKVKHANEDAIVMHPGPMNRGVEITSELADSKQSVITQQVRHGVLIRMAILDLMLQ